ncbi:unnamed protein product [Caenorhabditis nigoni]
MMFGKKGPLGSKPEHKSYQTRKLCVGYELVELGSLVEELGAPVELEVRVVEDGVEDGVEDPVEDSPTVDFEAVVELDELEEGVVGISERKHYSYDLKSEIN